MALTLTTPTITQANDAVTINVTDSTGEYNAVTNTGGWGSPNPAPTDIDGSDIHLYLDVVVTTSDGTETTYDQIELYDEFGPFSTVADLTYDITPDMLVSSGTAMGTATDTFTDGWYKITYSFVDDLSGFTNSTVTTQLLIDGVVRIAVGDKLRDIPYSSDWKLLNHDFKEWYDILYPMYYNGILEGINAEETVARKNPILSSLGTLQRLLNN